jgi:hypothetical protein
MRQLIKHFLWIALLVLGAESSRAFSLAGLIGNGGDKWQAPVIGYGLGGDLVAPKNLGEEYRRNIPVLYYAYDVNFLDYFGSNGPVSIDAAFSILNSLTNVDAYSSTLSEFPLETRETKYEAQALGLFDLKSFTLGAMMEQMGLATPERYTWTLHDRYAPPGCPVTTEYLVVQRNFDFTTSPLNQLQYSPYINDTLYTYNILEFCTGPNPLAETIPISVDPLADTYSPVASFQIGYGDFYTGLTRDDVAALRYLLSTNNINTETAQPNLLTTNAGAYLQITTQPLAPLLAAAQTTPPGLLPALFPGVIVASSSSNVSLTITTNITAYYTNSPGPDLTNYAPAEALVTSDLGLLLAQAKTNDPGTLQTLYPGLQISTITNGLGVVYTTNVTAFYTNSPGPDVTNYTPTQVLITSDLGQLIANLTNDPATLQALYPTLLFSTVTNTQTVVITTNITAYYTNAPGPTVTNYDSQNLDVIGGTGPSVAIPTLDFNLFYMQQLTNTALNSAAAIAQLQVLYPGLVILGATPYVGTVYTTNLTPYLTIPNGQAYPPAFYHVSYITNITQNAVLLYNYTFGNLMLNKDNNDNHFYPFTGFTGTNSGLYNNNETVWITNTFVTNYIGSPVGSPLVTNSIVTSQVTHNPGGTFFIMPTNWCGYSILATEPLQVLASYTNTVSTIATNLTGTTGYLVTTTTAGVYTNLQMVVEPGICEPVLLFATNYTTNVLTSYQYTLLNVVTNNYLPNSLQAIATTNIFSTNGAIVGTLVTNVTNPNLTNKLVNIPSGDFFIVPTNWCGYTAVTLLTNAIASTNTSLLSPTNSAGATNINIQYWTTTVSYFTNHTLLIQQGICEPVLVLATNITTAVTNTGYQNTLLNIATNFYSPTSLQIVVTTNVFTTNNAVVGTLITNVSNPNYTNSLVNTPSGDYFIIPTNWCGYLYVNVLTNVIATTNFTQVANSGAGPFTNLVTVTYFTNHTILVQPGICEPILQFATNYTSVFSTNYQTTFANLFVTNYYPTSSVIVLTTNIFTTNGAPLGTLFTNSPPLPPVGPPTGSNNVVVGVPTGEYFIIPANWCNYSIVATLFTNVLYTTNTVGASGTETVVVTNTTISSGGSISTVTYLETNTQVFSQTTITPFTNHTYQIQPDTCTSQAASTGLRQGIGRVQFVRANYDSLISQYFQPITNNYTMVLVTNGQLMTQYFQRIVTAPDFKFSAADLATGPSAIPAVFTFSRNINFDQGNILNGEAGPGVINSSTTFTFDKVGPVFFNSPSDPGHPGLDGTPYFTELPGSDVTDLYYAFYFVWASFDGSTNEPVVYPNGTSIANLQNEVLVQITPSSPLPDGTNAVPYVFTYTNSSAVAYTNTFVASGGSFQPPFTWTATGLPTGLTMTTVNGNGYLSGTPAILPAQSGVPFDFTVQLTDSLSRSVQWQYSITIH